MWLAWTLFLIYVVVTFFLAWMGQKKTDSLKSYALGKGDMSPWVVGLALAASMTSTATFVINPGIVYAYGLSALLGYGLAAGAGLMLGIVIISKGFRQFGVSSASLTVPHWISSRFDDRRMGFIYAILNLFLLAMVVLICYSMALLMMTILELNTIFPGYGFEVALAVTILFVFSYVFFGGTYAHAYTNTVQGVIMIGVSLLLILSGVYLFDGTFSSRLSSISPELTSVTNSKSILFRHWFEVFGANFLVGFALSLQPHFIIKSLYVKDERDLNRYLAVSVGVGILFSLVMLCGLYGRLTGSEFINQFMLQKGTGIDGFMPAYIIHTFDPLTASFISIAILAAGMSTLDGILVALSTIFANDVFLYLKEGGTEKERMDLAFRVGRYSLIFMGIAAFVLSLFQHYYKEFSVLIFAQEGIYALFGATFAPLLFGMFIKKVNKYAVLIASASALVVHFGFRYGKLTWLTAADYTNPGLTATYGLLASVAVMIVYFLGRAFLTAPEVNLSPETS